MAPRTPKKWTAGEDDILRKEVAAQSSEGEVRDWCQIAGKLPGRTNKDCRKRWHNTMAGEFRKGQWTKTEDEQLLNAVGKHGQRWTVVATAVSTRSAEQCAKRWQQSLNPDLDRSEWTGDEDQKLMQAVGVIGRQWTQIQRMHFPERSKNAIKNRYTIVSRKLRKQAKQPAIPEADTVMEDASGGNDSDDDGSDDGESDMDDPDLLSTLRHTGDGASSFHGIQGHSSLSLSDPTGRSNSWTNFDPMLTTQLPFLDNSLVSPSHPTHDSSNLWLWDQALPQPGEAEPRSDPFDPDLANFDLMIPDSGRGSMVSDGFGFNAGQMDANGQLQNMDNMDTNAVTVKLTLDNPNSETMQSLMKIAIENKAKFRVERD